MKFFDFIMCFTILLALVLVSSAGRTYPPKTENSKGAEGQQGRYTYNNHNSGWGGWGGWP
ncbi:hypothetical protein Hdeb2414_s0023g00636011 [Helianthus debilis subsp. tardiflorus]